MKVFRTPQTMQAHIACHQGLRIALVPTMGALHEGHLSLLRLARSQCELLVLSIFVNPTQFSPSEDLSTYPRPEEQDLALAQDCGVDLAFCPTPQSMYPQGFQTSIALPHLAQKLCGKHRPNHFAGVATVVTKLFQIVSPNLAVFGEKDFQQLAILRQLTRDLNMQVDILGAPIVREHDGLAMSSRNRHLNATQREQAPILHQILCQAKSEIQSNLPIQTVYKNAKECIQNKAPLAQLEYLSFCDAQSLEEQESLQAPSLLALACHFGNTRLIDNLQVEQV